MICHSPGAASGKEPPCQGRRLEFDPRVGKIPWRRAGQPVPVFLPGDSHGRGAWGPTVHGLQSQTRLNTATHGTVRAQQTRVLRETPRLLPGPGQTWRTERQARGQCRGDQTDKPGPRLPPRRLANSICKLV